MEEGSPISTENARRLSYQRSINITRSIPSTEDMFPSTTEDRFLSTTEKMYSLTTEVLGEVPAIKNEVEIFHQ